MTCVSSSRPRLLSAVKEHGTNNWVTIAGAMDNKTRTQCRTRFSAIYKAYLKDPEAFKISEMKTPDLQRRRQQLCYDKLNDRLTAFLAGEEKEDARAAATAAKLEANFDEAKGTYTTPDGVIIMSIWLDFILREERLIFRSWWRRRICCVSCTI